MTLRFGGSPSAARGGLHLELGSISAHAKLDNAESGAPGHNRDDPRQFPAANRH